MKTCNDSIQDNSLLSDMDWINNFIKELFEEGVKTSLPEPTLYFGPKGLEYFKQLNNEEVLTQENETAIL
jgi:hypothetical protein